MREKRTRSQEKHEPLFDFSSDGFDARTPFQVNYEGVPDNTISSLAESTKKKVKQAQKQVKRIKEVDAPGETSLPTSKQDPMNPQIYEGHHRRMEREERRMQVQERQQLTVMASKVRTQIELLARGDWRTNIEKIVRIQDISDAKETARKRDLALKEMRIFLAKFDEYNRRHNRREEKSSNGAERSRKSHHSPKKTNQTKPKVRTGPATNGVEDATSEEQDGTHLSIRPFAFGYMVPPRKFPFREFELSKLLLMEVESVDLIENMKKTMKTTD